HLFPRHKRKKSNLVGVVFLNDLLYHNNMKDNIKLLPGESILIKKLGPTDKTSTVTILGQVRRPGVYVLKRGMTLYNLIVEAGGYTSAAYPKALVFIRRSVKALQKIQLNESILDIKSEMAKSAPVTGVGSAAQQGLQYKAIAYQEKQYIASLKKVSMQGLGRISLDIPNHLRFLKYSNQNIKLVPGDFVFIPTKPDYVLVMGAVFNQIAIPYIPGKTVKWYLNQAGGFRSNANTGETYLIKANGRVLSAAEMSSFWSFIGLGQNFYNTPVKPGSAIVVPPKFEAPILWMPLIKDITQIMFQSISTVALIRYL
ncbi:MAG: SLBB domain-containing protein, partial [Candidatus Acidulodesulfobacterium sp.]